MKIILISDVKKQGHKGDILVVKDGFGKFLINNKQAIMATDDNLKQLERFNTKEAIASNLHLKDMEALKVALAKQTLTFKLKVGEQDRVFGSITSKQIADAIKKEGYNIDKKKIMLDHDLTSLGFHDVKIELHKQVIATVRINIIKG